MNYKLITNVEVDGVDIKDYPDFCDAFISSADYNGEPMTEFQLDQLSDDFVHDEVLKSIV
jgi:hypothetical protein